MGAIFGILGSHDPGELSLLGERLAHRGSRHVEWRPAPEISLGFRSGPDPLPCRPAELPLVLDAHINNASELAALADVPKDAPPPSPAELLGTLLAREGTAAFRHLRGPYAVAWWDAEHQQLTLACDFCACRSLLYTLSGGRLVFASEIKALLPFVPTPPRIDRTTLQRALATHTPRGNATCFLDIRPVPPGHWITFGAQPCDGGGKEWVQVASGRVWEPRLEIRRRSDAACIRDFRETFLSAVDRQVSVAGRVGIALSAGVDAASVLAAIRHVAPKIEVRSYCVGLGSEDPELAGGAEVARHFGSGHRSLVIDPEDLPDLLETFVWHVEEPVGREDVLSPFLCARAGEGEIDTLFGGYWSDALLGGMPRHRLILLARAIPPLRRGLLDVFRYSRLGLSPRTRTGRALLHLAFRGAVHPPVRVHGAQPLEEDAGLAAETAAFGNDSPEPLSEFLYRALLLDCGKMYFDRVHAAFGVALNSPFFDPEVIACSLRMPDHLKIRGRVRKLVLREALRDLLPPAIAKRPKSLQRVRNDLALADVFERLAARMLDPETVRRRGLFDPDHVARVCRREPGAPYPRAQFYRLWSLVLCEIWCRNLVDREPDRPAPKRLAESRVE